ncbi:hypothetical protein [Emticicia sp. C21]|uniref:hypothetical protein n=1 Tax=Emticicia sp. C21 TaxID=2302915 RepID=UPI000E350892|nr:hypothetical protein [Emticicia sp. C21]RFS14957.1 hypothetical protein D0T08_17880 [Emticicia sp. C21]
MKKILILFIATHLSGNVFAQSGTLLPDGFIVPNLAAAPACTVEDKGKIYFNTSSSTMMVCNGIDWVGTTEVWGKAGSDIFFSTGKVGINTSSPQYTLDVNGTGKFDNVLVSGLGVGGSAPVSGIEVTDGAIAIKSTTGSKVWKYQYSDANNHLTLQENGITRMIFSNGGNIGIGSVTPTARLSVDGTGNFSGNLTVNNGKGIIRSINNTQLKYLTATISTGSSFTVIAGGCATATGSLSAGGFSAAPSVSIANLLSGTGDFGKLITNVQSATSTQTVVRFCNPTGSNITLNNIVFNLICIGTCLRFYFSLNFSNKRYSHTYNI